MGEMNLGGSVNRFVCHSIERSIWRLILFNESAYNSIWDYVWIPIRSDVYFVRSSVMSNVKGFEL